MKFDMHVHTHASRDCNVPIDALIERCLEVGLDGIAIADHDVIEGALQASENNSGIHVIVGEEIRTAEGEVLALFLTERIEPRMSVEKTIEAIADQGGLVCVPHPFDRFRRAADVAKHSSLFPTEQTIIETKNGHCLFDWWNRKAEAWAQAEGFAAAGGSDAHLLEDVGRVYVELEDAPTRETLVQLLREGVVRGSIVPFTRRLRQKIAKELRRLGG